MLIKKGNFTNSNFRLILLSSDGIGSGKTTLARSLSSTVVSLAGAMRRELAELYPSVDWNNLTQEYKATPLAKLGGQTPRDLLISHGQAQKAVHGLYYWCKKTEEVIDFISFQTPTIVIDDVRMVFELDYFKYSKFGSITTHIHVVNPNAVKEPQFENEQLAKLADYSITWGNK